MKKTRHTTDQIIAKLRHADVEFGNGKKVPEVCKILEINPQTYYRWRQKYGGMQPEMVKQFKALVASMVNRATVSGTVAQTHHWVIIKTIGGLPVVNNSTILQLMLPKVYDPTPGDLPRLSFYYRLHRRHEHSGG